MKRGVGYALWAVTTILFCASRSEAQNVKVRTLTEQEVVDLMVGGAIQGTRSSDTTQMVNRAKALLAEGKQFKIISVDDLPADWTTVTAAGGIGGGGAWDYVRDRTKQQNLPSVTNPTAIGVKALEKHLGKKFSAVIRNEAAGATLNVFEVATALDLPVVDACVAGRAKPELEQTLTYIAGVNTTPAALVTRWGDVMFIDHAVDDYRYEDLGRAIAVASGGGVSSIRGLLTTEQIKRITIHGALSEAILFGKTVREAKAQGKNPIEALLKVSGGHKMFEGVVASAEQSGNRGFTWWNVTLNGTGPYSGHKYRVWVKNENILSWLDDKPDVMSPDLLYNLDTETGQAHNSAGLGSYKIGARITMIARAPAPAWRSAKGIEVIGPRHFGFDFDYVPLERILQTRPKFTD